MQPYALVENEEFQEFVMSLNPSYCLPGRKSVTDTHVSRLYQETLQFFKTYVADADFAALTVDCWSSKAKTPYITATAHFFDKELNIVSGCLACTEMMEDHTAENIAARLELIIGEYDLNGKITCITSDAGRNIVKSTRDCLCFPLVYCFGHSLNTAIDNLFSEFSNLVSKMKAIQNVFGYSNNACRDLKKKQVQLNYKIVAIPSYCKTRWWSMLKLMTVIANQRIVLNSFFETYSKEKFVNNIITLEEYQDLVNLIKLLEIIQIFTDKMSSEKKITASMIIPLCCKFESQLKKVELKDGEIIREKCLNCIMDVLNQRYFDNFECYAFLAKCSALDPRFKLKYIKTESKKEATKQALELESSGDFYGNKDVTVNEKSSTSPVKKKVKLSSLFDSDSDCEDESNKTNKEIESFFRSPMVHIDDDPIAWWKCNKNSYPNLFKLAMKYLCAQATSVPSERVFSKSGNIVEDHRTVLTPEHVEELVFLACNKHFIKLLSN